MTLSTEAEALLRQFEQDACIIDIEGVALRLAAIEAAAFARGREAAIRESEAPSVECPRCEHPWAHHVCYSKYGSNGQCQCPDMALAQPTSPEAEA
jgi:hypothetical protein